MLISYRGCLFLARKGQIEIWLLNPESDAFDIFAPDEGDIVVDMGAHVGKYALPSAQKVGEQGHVFAFEAVPDHYNALKKNAELNNFSNITTLNAATYNKNQEMWLVGWDLKPKPDWDHPKAAHINPDGSIPVEAVTVDKVLEQHGFQSVDYVKVDIGRQELEALQGMVKTLEASESVTILVEIGKNNFEQVNALLTDLGFTGTSLDDSWGANGLRDYVYRKTPS